MNEPIPTRDRALEEYGRAIALLTAAERALRNAPSKELERTVLAACDLVLARRVRACRSLIEAGVRLPAETVADMLRDEELVTLPTGAASAEVA